MGKVPSSAKKKVPPKKVAPPKRMAQTKKQSIKSHQFGNKIKIKPGYIANPTQKPPPVASNSKPPPPPPPAAAAAAAGGQFAVSLENVGLAGTSSFGTSANNNNMAMDMDLPSANNSTANTNYTNTNYFTNTNSFAAIGSHPPTPTSSTTTTTTTTQDRPPMTPGRRGSTLSALELAPSTPGGGGARSTLGSAPSTPGSARSTPGRDNHSNVTLEELQAYALGAVRGGGTYFPPNDNRFRNLPTGLIRRYHQVRCRDFFISMNGVLGFDSAKYGVMQCLTRNGKGYLPDTQEGKAFAALFSAVARIREQMSEIEAAARIANKVTADNKVAALKADTLQDDDCKKGPNLSLRQKKTRRYLKDNFEWRSATRIIFDPIFKQEMKKNVLAMRIRLGWTKPPAGYNLDYLNTMLPKYEAIKCEMDQQEALQAASAATATERNTTVEHPTETTNEQQQQPQGLEDGSIVLSKAAVDLIKGAQDTAQGAQSALVQVSKDSTATAKGAQETAQGAQAAMVQLSKDNTAQHASRDVTAQQVSKDNTAQHAESAGAVKAACATAQMAIAASNPHLSHMLQVDNQATTNRQERPFKHRRTSKQR